MFATVTQVVTSVVISVTWLIPGLNPDAQATPLWAILPALALGLTGTAIYKHWELRYDEADGVHARGLEPVPDDLYSIGGRRLARKAQLDEGDDGTRHEQLTVALLAHAAVPAAGDLTVSS